ncbi:MAG: class I SAM-dependent methyltransferase, partial [Actinomycetota bacterium]
HMIFVGGGDFRKIGEEFFTYFVELGELKPNARVLDIGCGVGRMARPLTRYLSADGSYEGFDIVPSGIEWCREKICVRFPNFRFQVADIYNQVYNPRGSTPAEKYEFPYDSEHFDLAFATSVFTHMLPDAVENYLRETHRVLKPNGTCLTTFFLQNAETESLRGTALLDFRSEGDGYRTVDATRPEEAVAYEENDARSMFERCALEVIEPIRYGSWSGRPDPLSLQDIVVARRNPPQ